MYKRKFVRKLGKPADQRKALVKSQVKDVILHGYIRTTLSRSKEVSRVIDVLADYVIKGNIKKAFDYLRDKRLLNKFIKIVQLSGGRKSGLCTRVNLSNRKGDNARLCLVELVANYASSQSNIQDDKAK